MPYDPTPLQVTDSNAMLEYEHALLWADAGTGKTVTALEAFRKGGYKTGVIVCPKIALTMWQEEIAFHLGKRAWVVRSGKQQKIFSGPPYDFLVITFDLVAKHTELIKRFIRGGETRLSPNEVMPPSALIIDEAHMIKTYTAKRTQALYGRDTLSMGNLAGQFRDIFQLTGTPIMRHADDLWAQLRPVRGDVLKSFNVFTHQQWVNEFCTTKTMRVGNQVRTVINGSRNEKKLKAVLTACCVIQRKLVDLPPITHRTVDTTFSGVPNVTVDMETFAKQLADPDSEMATMRRMLGIAKAKDVAAYVMHECPTPLLIGYWHKDVGAELEHRLTGYRVAMVDGATPQNKRDLIRLQFNNGEIDFLLGQMQAMNASWNLQELCKHVVIAEELPSPSALHQFYSRVYRKGQKNRVQVDHMRSSHEIDKAMKRLSDAKAATIERVLE